MANQTNVIMSSLTDGAAYTGQNASNSAGMSMEQLLSPILVRNGGDPAGTGFGYFETPRTGTGSSGPFGASHNGPTRSELDPYFSTITGNKNWFFSNNDFVAVCNNGPEQDLSLAKTTRGSVSTVCPVALRGPVMLTSFGFDLAERPVPHVGSNPYVPDTNVVNNRGTWKTGPIDLKWDEERKVWTGGPHIVEGYATTAIPAATSPCSPSNFKMKLFRQYGSSSGNLKGSQIGEVITVVNRDPSLSQDLVEGMIYVMAIRINYEWRPLWVGCPDTDEEAPSGSLGCL